MRIEQLKEVEEYVSRYKHLLETMGVAKDLHDKIISDAVFEVYGLKFV